MNTKIPSGSALIDWILEGGYEKDVLTCIYGPPGSGKTNLLLLLARTVPKDKKLIYIDTEGNFSISRFKQLTDDYKDLLKRILFLKPTTFEEQRKAFDKLRKIVNNKVYAILLDSMAMLYRLEFSKNKTVYDINRELGLQISFLAEIARKKKIPVIVTNQVYDVDNEAKMVGGNIIQYASKCLIELQKNNDERVLILKKHRSLPSKKINFKITDLGIEEE